MERRTEPGNRDDDMAPAQEPAHPVEQVGIRKSPRKASKVQRVSRAHSSHHSGLCEKQSREPECQPVAADRGAPRRSDRRVCNVLVKCVQIRTLTMPTGSARAGAGFKPTAWAVQARSLARRAADAENPVEAICTAVRPTRVATGSALTNLDCPCRRALPPLRPSPFRVKTSTRRPDDHPGAAASPACLRPNSHSGCRERGC